MDGFYLTLVPETGSILPMLVSFNNDLKLSFTLTTEVADGNVQNNNVCQSFLMVLEGCLLLIAASGHKMLTCHFGR